MQFANQNFQPNTLQAQPIIEAKSPLPTVVKPKKNWLFRITGIFFLVWNRVALTLLLIEGFWGLWESLRFLFVDFTQLNTSFESGLINSQEISQLFIDYGLMFGITLVSFFMAHRLRKVQETLAHTTELLFATAVIVATSILKNQLAALDLISILLEFI